MRVLVMVKATKKSESGEMLQPGSPDFEKTQQMFAEMGKYNDELVKAGVLLAAEGLVPSSKGKRVRFSGEARTVIDGPFSETKELVAGFWLWQVKDMDEAVEWVRRCPNPMLEESEIEIRPIASLEDFGPELTKELREQEERQRAAIAAQQKG